LRIRGGTQKQSTDNSNRKEETSPVHL
jgi:hypothetical protein